MQLHIKKRSLAPVRRTERTVIPCGYPDQNLRRPSHRRVRPSQTGSSAPALRAFLTGRFSTGPLQNAARSHVQRTGDPVCAVTSPVDNRSRARPVGFCASLPPVSPPPLRKPRPHAKRPADGARFRAAPTHAENSRETCPAGCETPPHPPFRRKTSPFHFPAIYAILYCKSIHPGERRPVPWPCRNPPNS